ncbi:MAG: hypothetical protein SFY80_13665 [Verrucomicrobiota bacterium]|nr:hypothetical protein [Verrucomicrobiota bacterium]
METLTNSFSPTTGTKEEWNEAFSRVDDFFRAHRVRQTFLILEILRSAAEKHKNSPGESPTRLAVKEAQEQIDTWVKGIMAGSGESDVRKVPMGLVAFLLCDGPRKFPEYFLGRSNLPSELVDGMRQRSLEAGPDLEVSSMVPRPIDLGLLPEVADDTWEFLQRNPMVRMFLVWTFFLAIVIGGLVYFIN